MTSHRLCCFDIHQRFNPMDNFTDLKRLLMDIDDPSMPSPVFPPLIR